MTIKTDFNCSFNFDWTATRTLLILTRMFKPRLHIACCMRMCRKEDFRRQLTQGSVSSCEHFFVCTHSNTCKSYACVCTRKQSCRPFAACTRMPACEWMYVHAYTRYKDKHCRNEIKLLKTLQNKGVHVATC